MEATDTLTYIDQALIGLAQLAADLDCELAETDRYSNRADQLKSALAGVDRLTRQLDILNPEDA